MDAERTDFVVPVDLCFDIATFRRSAGLLSRRSKEYTERRIIISWKNMLMAFCSQLGKLNENVQWHGDSGEITYGMRRRVASDLAVATIYLLRLRRECFVEPNSF